ncbi:MAG TPA: hypothetical protein PLO23_00370 [Alphaproteobacteria bacterium]|nr:hypothetical protein [Alphaproteobacteria bacterium]
MLRKRFAAYLNGLTFWLSGKGFGQFNSDFIVADMEKLVGVKGVRDVHIWRQEDKQNALAAHIVIEDFSHREAVQTSLKAMLNNRYGIAHSILEFETPGNQAGTG